MTKKKASAEKAIRDIRRATRRRALGPGNKHRDDDDYDDDDYDDYEEYEDYDDDEFDSYSDTRFG